MSEEGFDLLGLGAVAVDEMIYVEHYPAADAKVAVQRRERHCGGLAATALVAAARLGARCAYAGVLGTDEPSQFASGRLVQEGVDLSQARRCAEARIVQSFIVVDQASGSRALFFDRNGVIGADPQWPPEGFIRRARVLLVDHLGVEGMIRAARITRAAGRPVVADLEEDTAPGFAELLDLADHLVLSQRFAERITGTDTPAEAARRLWHDRRAAAVVTCGRQGCWVVSRETGLAPCHYPAFAVQEVDTNGCGDVFHGAYAVALGWGMELEERIRLAAAAAALKATRRGGQEGAPALEAVQAFLRRAGKGL